MAKFIFDVIFDIYDKYLAFARVSSDAIGVKVGEIGVLRLVS